MIELHVNKHLPEEGIMRRVGEAELGTAQTESDMLRKIFFMYGPGKYFIYRGFTSEIPRIDPLWLGWVKDRDPYLVTQIGKPDKYPLLEEKLGIEELERSDVGLAKIKKPGLTREV